MVEGMPKEVSDDVLLLKNLEEDILKGARAKEQVHAQKVIAKGTDRMPCPRGHKADIPLLHLEGSFCGEIVLALPPEHVKKLKEPVGMIPGRHVAEVTHQGNVGVGREEILFL